LLSGKSLCENWIIKLIQSNAARGSSNTKKVAVAIIVTECELAIEKYCLDLLLTKAQKSVYQLEENEREMLNFGLVKLGEALTFCRDRSNSLLQKTGIISPAIGFAKARNHLVHHQMYHTYFELGHLGKPYDVFQDIISDLPPVATLCAALNQLKNSGLIYLIKPIGLGKNEFPFSYDHYLTALKQEFTKLKNLLEKLTAEKVTAEEMSKDIRVEAQLENRIRNIVGIMVDLIDKNAINLNQGRKCERQKVAVDQFNSDFVMQHNKFALFFRRITEYRNSLCHLDNSLKRPYTSPEELLKFAEQLKLLNEEGYIEKLTTKISSIQDYGNLSLRQIASASSAFQLFQQTTGELGAKRKASSNTSVKPTPEAAEKKLKFKEKEDAQSLVPYSDSSSGEENADQPGVTAATTFFKPG